MKFAHIADIHIGNWRDSKLRELGAEAFIKTIDACILEKVDFVLIAGDLFHTAIPGIEYIKIVVKKLQELKTKEIPVYYIAGSHDYSPSGKTMLDIIEEAHLGKDVMRGDITPEGKLRLKFTEDNKTGAKITGIIGRGGMLERQYYEDLDSKNIEKEEGFKIFMFHTAIEELKPKELKEMAASPISFLPKGFDYYAGGHVHIVKKYDMESQGYKNVIYPGPTFPANFSELEKLSHGGFYIYKDGETIFKPIITKETLPIHILLDNKTIEDAQTIIKETLDETDPEDKIVLIRIEGKIQGKKTELDIGGEIKKLYEKKAYFVMKKTSGLLSEGYEDISLESMSAEETEARIIDEQTGKYKNNFSDEKRAITSLMKVFSEEKHEGEKNTDYENRIISSADIIMEEGTKKSE